MGPCDRNGLTTVSNEKKTQGIDAPVVLHNVFYFDRTRLSVIPTAQLIGRVKPLLQACRGRMCATDIITMIDNTRHHAIPEVESKGSNILFYGRHAQPAPDSVSCRECCAAEGSVSDYC